jgi:hypothetical protein
MVGRTVPLQGLIGGDGSMLGFCWRYCTLALFVGCALEGFGDLVGWTTSAVICTWMVPASFAKASYFTKRYDPSKSRMSCHTAPPPWYRETVPQYVHAPIIQSLGACTTVTKHRRAMELLDHQGNSRGEEIHVEYLGTQQNLSGKVLHREYKAIMQMAPERRCYQPHACLFCCKCRPEA